MRKRAWVMMAATAFVMLGTTSTATRAVAACSPGWNVVSAPAADVLRTTTGVSASDAWATSPGSIYHWDGAGWTKEFHQAGDWFAGASAASATDAWMVGANGPNANAPFSLHWGGASWSAVDLPVRHLPVGGPYPAGVVDVSPTDAWATDTSGDIYHWDGGVWTRVRQLKAEVRGMAGSGPSDIWVLASAKNDFTEHWDGLTWSKIPFDVPHQGRLRPSAIDSTSATDAWVVGVREGRTEKTFAAHWDGAAWSVVPSPNAGTKGSELLDVSANTASDAWAVGMSGRRVHATLAEHWDGSVWTLATIPGGSGTSSQLLSVSVFPDGEALAVGSTWTPGVPGSSAIAEAYCPA